MPMHVLNGTTAKRPRDVNVGDRIWLWDERRGKYVERTVRRITKPDPQRYRITVEYEAGDRNYFNPTRTISARGSVPVTVQRADDETAVRERLAVENARRIAPGLDR